MLTPAMAGNVSAGYAGAALNLVVNYSPMFSLTDREHVETDLVRSYRERSGAMARYGTFKYGAPRKYGASAVTEAGEVTWVLQFDWTGDGSFDGANEANRLVDFSLKRGDEQYISTSGRGFAGTSGGTATLIMDNYDRRYDPRNAASPLSPNVDTGKEVYIGIIINATQTRYDILRGQIGDIRPISGKQQVRITVLDYTSILENTSCGTMPAG